MQNNLLQLYKRAIGLREPWVNRWDDARRYTMPTSDNDLATLYDATAPPMTYTLGMESTPWSGYLARDHLMSHEVQTDVGAEDEEKPTAPLLLHSCPACRKIHR